MIKRYHAIFGSFLFFLISFSFAEAQEPFPYLAEVFNNQVNIRAGQNLNFEKIGMLSKGDEVVAVAEEFGWIKIRLPKGIPVYISSSFIEQLGQEVGRIKGSRVNVRSKNLATASVLGQVKKGTLVQILACEADWCKVEPLENIYGWVSAEYLKMKSRNVPPPVAVLPPTQNIYELKRRQELKQAQAAEEARQKMMAEEVQPAAGIGYIELMSAGTLSELIRHKLVVQGVPKFYLKGYRSIIDGFLNMKVQIEGEPQDEPGADLPVLLVTKIQLVL